MERHHLDITEKTCAAWILRRGSAVLIWGAVRGWATRLRARIVAKGSRVLGRWSGVEISDEMIRQARAASKEFRQRDVRGGLVGAEFRGKKTSLTR